MFYRCLSTTLFQDEYDELLKYAMVMPTYDPNKLPKTMADLRGSFPNVQVTIHSDSAGK